MKRFSFFSLILIGALLPGFASAQDDAKPEGPVKIQAAAAKDNVGKQAVVSGTVAEVNKAEKLIRLNLDKPYPKQSFTAVIFAPNTNSFGDFDKLIGKNVEITGKIAGGLGNPQFCP